MNIIAYGYMPPPDPDEVHCPVCGEPYNLYPGGDDSEYAYICGQCQTEFNWPHDIPLDAQ